MTLERLLTLQEVDSALDRLEVRRRQLEAGEALAVARDEADAAERTLGEFRLKLDELGRDQGRYEHEIDSMSQKENAEQTRLYDGSIVNAKELEALQHEIASLRKRRSGREDELLVVMEQREEYEAGAAQAQGRWDELRGALERVATGSAEELASVTAELEARNADCDR